MRTRTKRLFSLALTTALVAGAFAMPAAEAAKKKKKLVCPAYAPAAPASPAAAAAEAPAVPAVKVTDKHTEEAPLEVTLEQGAGLWMYAPDPEAIITQIPVEDDTQFVNVQVYSKAPTTGLFVKQEWDAGSPDDLDLYMYDVTGTEVNTSGAFNAAPIEPVSTTTGGAGYEQISGHAAAQCDGYTLESRTYMTQGQTVTMKFWLGEAAAAPAE